MANKNFNIAYWLASAFVESKLVLALVPAVLLFGFVGLLLTPREENPQIVVPSAEVTIAVPGLQPEEVEHLLLTPFEQHLNTMLGVKHTFGTAEAGLAKIQIQFEVGEDKTESFVRLHDQVFRFKPQLPPFAGEPHVRLVDVDDVPFLVVTLASSQYDRYQLTEMADRMTEHLHSVENVGFSEVLARQDREVRIEVDPTRLQALGLGINQLRSHIQAANIDHSLGLKVVAGKNNQLRLSHKFQTLDDIKELVVFRDQERVIHLRDIAHVTQVPEAKNHSFSRFNYGPASPHFPQTQGREMTAVHIGIAKRNGANAVPLAADLLARIEQMQQQWLPQSVDVVVTRNDGEKADDSVNYLMEHLFIAIAVVAVILWVFLGWRASAIVMVTIPIVFALVIGIDLLAGPTLNRITLYALILALGMLVDDAIVVIENIHRHNQMLPENSSKATYSQAIVRAASEIGNPTTLATVTVVVVFLSLLLISGMLGDYFYPIAFNVPVAMIASLLVAYMVTPWAARRFLPVTREAHKEIGVQKIYRRLFAKLYQNTRWRRGFYGLVVMLLILSLLQPAWQFIRPQGVSGEVSPLGVPLAFLPKDNKNTFLVTLHLPDDTPLEDTDKVVRAVSKQLLSNPFVRDTQTFVGIPSVIDFNGQLKGNASRLGQQFAEIRVNLLHKSQRDVTSIAIVEQLRHDLARVAADYPSARIQLVEDPPGPPVRATVLAEIHGWDNDKRQRLTEQVDTLFRQTWDMAEVWNSNVSPINEFKIDVDQEKVQLAGLAVQEVTVAINAAMRGEVVNHLYQADARNPIPVRLMVPHNLRITPDLLAQIAIKNQQGKLVPLSSVVNVTTLSKPQPIFHKDNERVSFVGGELAASAPVNAVLDLDRRLNALNTVEGEKITTGNLGFVATAPTTLTGTLINWGGELRLMMDAFRDMGLALGLSLVAIYFLLVSYYQSFRLPLLVMVSIPLGFIGVFPGHWLLGQSFTAPSMIGVIALAGVAIRNALLIVDFIQEQLAQGTALDIAVANAGALRIIPITLTTLAIAFGTMIMIPDPVMGGLAISLIFGSLSSAILTLLVVPLLYARR